MRNADEIARELYVGKVSLVSPGVIVNQPSLGSTGPFSCATPEAMSSKSRRNSKEGPMNSGVIRSALNTALALELGYRETPIFREIGTKSERPTKHQHSARLFEDEFACLLSVI